MNDVLVRQKVDDVDVKLREEAVRIAEEAHTVLYYSPLKARIGTAAVEEKLLKALQTLGIEPFSAESVEKYKAQMLKKLNAGIGLWRWGNSDGAASLAIISALVGIVALVVSGCLAGNHLVHAAKYCLGACSVCASVIGLLIYISRGDREEFSWTSTAINSYRAEIPTFALERAIQIKKAVGAVDITVESLRTEHLFKDPFLRIDCGRMHYYVDVWDEPKFEGRRTK